MSSENEVVSQTPATETSVDEMKTNAKKVMEQAVAASQKRSLDHASEDSNSLVENSADDDSNSNLAKNGSRTKKLRVSNDENVSEESLDQVEDDNVEDEENDEEDIDEEEDVDGEEDVGEYGEDNGSVGADGEQELGDDTNGVDEDAGDDE